MVVSIEGFTSLSRCLWFTYILLSHFAARNLDWTGVEFWKARCPEATLLMVSNFIRFDRLRLVYYVFHDFLRFYYVFTIFTLFPLR